MNKRELRKLLFSATEVLVANQFQERKARPIVFSRNRGPFLDLVYFATSRSGHSIDWAVNTWTPAVEEEPATFDTEVDLSCLGIAAGGNVSIRGIGDTSFWSVVDVETASRTAIALEETLFKIVLPWFAGIVDGKSYCRACKLGNGGWWQTVRQTQRDYIEQSIDRALRGELEIKAIKIV